MSSRILVVDDEPDMRLLLRLALRGAEFVIDEAATGEEALEAAATERFDLILLDLNLPGISGMQVLEEWGSTGVLPEMPVLMLTADARPGLDVTATALGARGLLTKPVRPAELVTIIRAVLDGDEASPATVEGL